MYLDASSESPGERPLSRSERVSSVSKSQSWRRTSCLTPLMSSMGLSPRPSGFWNNIFLLPNPQLRLCLGPTVEPRCMCPPRGPGRGTQDERPRERSKRKAGRTQELMQPQLHHCLDAKPWRELGTLHRPIKYTVSCDPHGRIITLATNAGKRGSEHHLPGALGTSGIKPKTNHMCGVCPPSSSLFNLAYGAQAGHSWQKVSVLDKSSTGELEPVGHAPSSHPAEIPGAGLHTFLPGQGDDVRRTLTHHLGDVHRAVDPACDGDGPEHSLGLQLRKQRTRKSRGAGWGAPPTLSTQGPS